MAEAPPELLAYLKEPDAPVSNAPPAGMIDYLNQPDTKKSRKDSILERLTRVGVQSAMKGAASIPDLALNLPNAVVNLPKAAYGTAMNLAGRPDLAPDVNLQPNYAREALYKSGLASEEYDPKTPTERVIGATLEGAISTALSGKPSLGMLGLGATASGVGQTVAETTDSPMAGLAANLLTVAAAPKAASMINKRAANISAAKKGQKQLNAPRDNALAAGLEKGLVASPSEMKNRGFTKTMLSSEAGKIASEGEASIRNADVIHNMVSKDIGIPENMPLTRDVFKEVRDAAHESGYMPLRNLGIIKPDKKYYDALSDLAAAETSAAKSFPKAASMDARKLADDLNVEQFDSAAAVDQISELRAAADKAYASGDKKLGGVNKRAAKALEDALDTHISQTGNRDLLTAYRNARQNIAKTYTIESVVNPATGIVDAQKLAKILASSKTGGKLSGDIRTAAEFAKMFPKSTKPVEQAAGQGISKLDAAKGGLMGTVLGGAALTGGASIPATLATAALGTALPAATSAIARKRVFSKGFQESQIPKYNKNALTVRDFSKEDLARAQLMSDQAMRKNEK